MWQRLKGKRLGDQLLMGQKTEEQKTGGNNLDPFFIGVNFSWSDLILPICWVQLEVQKVHKTGPGIFPSAL